MTDLEKSRQFWERVISTIEVSMFVGMAFLLYFIAGVLVKLKIDVGPITGVILQIIFVGFIIYINKSFMAELDRRLPALKRNYFEE